MESEKAYYIEKMGESLGEQFHVLWHEVAWLHQKWIQWTELFNSLPTYLNLLGRVAPTLFWIFEKSLLEDIILHITRLTDPAKQRKFTNLTINNLPNLVDPIDGFPALVKNAVGKAEACRQIRNVHIAHLDLGRHLGKTLPLEGITATQINEAIGAIGNVLNAVSVHYTAIELSFNINTIRQGVNSLIYFLKIAVEEDESRETEV